MRGRREKGGGAGRPLSRYNALLWMKLTQDASRYIKLENVTTISRYFHLLCDILSAAHAYTRTTTTKVGDDLPMLVIILVVVTPFFFLTQVSDSRKTTE